MGLNRENTQKIRKVTPSKIMGNNNNRLIIYDNILCISLKHSGVKGLTSTPELVLYAQIINTNYPSYSVLDKL